MVIEPWTLQSCQKCLQVESHLVLPLRYLRRWQSGIKKWLSSASEKTVIRGFWVPQALNPSKGKASSCPGSLLPSLRRQQQSWHQWGLKQGPYCLVKSAWKPLLYATPDKTVLVIPGFWVPQALNPSPGHWPAVPSLKPVPGLLAPELTQTAAELAPMAGGSNPRNRDSFLWAAPGGAARRAWEPDVISQHEHWTTVTNLSNVARGDLNFLSEVLESHFLMPLSGCHLRR